jgi:hypothetical protein
VNSAEESLLLVEGSLARDLGAKRIVAAKNLRIVHAFVRAKSYFDSTVSSREVSG